MIYLSCLENIEYCLILNKFFKLNMRTIFHCCKVTYSRTLMFAEFVRKPFYWQKKYFSLTWLLFVNLNFSWITFLNIIFLHYKDRFRLIPSCNNFFLLLLTVQSQMNYEKICHIKTTFTSRMYESSRKIMNEYLLFFL